MTKEPSPYNKKVDSRTVPVSPIVEGVIWKEFLRFFFPLLFGSLIQQVYNIADAVIVGRFVGKAALSSVAGSTGMILSMIIYLFIGFAGSSVLCAQYYGGRQYRKLHRAVGTGYGLSAAFGALFMVLTLVFVRPVLAVMETPPQILELSVLYLRIIAAGMVPSMIYNMGAGILRAIGDSRRPLVFLIATSVSNVLLDLTLVGVLGFGVAGAAAATVFCQYLSAALVTGALLRKGYLKGKGILERKMAVRILLIGIPLAGESLSYTFANLFVQRAVNSFGTDVVAAYAAFGRIEMLFWAFMGSFGIAVSTFVGQNYGAGRMDRVFSSIRQGGTIMFAAMAAVIASLFAGSGTLQSFFSTDPEVIAQGTQMMHFLLPFYALYVPIELFFGALRGLGNSFAPSVISFFGICVLRCFWILFAVPRVHTMETVLMCFPFTWIPTTIAYFLYYLYFTRRIRASA